MPQRMISAAKADLTEVAQVLNPEAYRQRAAEVAQAEAEARGIAAKYVAETVTAFTTLRDEVLEEACGLRDQYDELIREGELGTLSAKEFEDRLGRLEAEKRRVNIRAERLGRDVGVVAKVEADPVAWVDERFYSNYPNLQPEFSF
jgi:hypothetical protein